MKASIQNIITLLLLTSALAARAQGSAFTYQGQLANNGLPANGSYDLTFSLFSASNGVGQVGGTLTNSTVAVSNGLFTAALDFGNQFPGADRWLEIGVRTNGGGTFTTLSPRQKLTPAPYAIYSAGATTAATATTATSFTGNLNGEVTGTQGSTAVSSVGGQTAANVAAGANAANAAASANTASAIVKRDTSGNFSAGTITGNLSGNATTATTANNFSGSLSGDVTGTQGVTVVANVGGQSAATVASGASAANTATSANTPSTIVKRDASGNFSAGTVSANLSGNATTANNFSGSLSGDVTGTQSTTFVANVGGQSAANVAAGVSAANAATSANITNAIVKRDGSGNFSAGAVMATSFGGNGSGLTNLNGANLVSGSVGSNQLASGAALANLQASGQLGVAGGGIVLSTQANATNLLSAGYTILGNMLTAENWASGSAINAPSARALATAVWTGTQVIVWGGLNGTALDTGASFDPVANAWTALPTNNAPSPRYYHAAIWTGTEMIIWGGQNGGGLTGQLNTGARYNPGSNTWTTMSTNGAPTPRDEMDDAVWTGTEMIVWGGYDPVIGDAVATGGRYNPATDTWTTMTTNGAPHASEQHAAVWTGTEMLIWGGGYGNLTTLNTGGRYNPASDTWTPISTANAPAARFIPYYVWTGKELIIWGGRTTGSFSSAPNTGGRYNPASDTWATMTTTGAPSARSDYPPRAVWTGTEMIIWGGQPASGVAPPNDGGRYDPAADTWKGTTLLNAPSGRANLGLVWAGSSMIVFGGVAGGSNAIIGDTSIYTPPRTLYLYLKP